MTTNDKDQRMQRRTLAAVMGLTLVTSLLGVASPPASAAPISTADVIVVVRGSDNALWYRLDEGDTPETVFTTWTSLGGQTNLAPSLSSDNLLTIRGLDGATWYREHNDVDNTWGPWTSLGGLTNDTPVASRFGDVYIRGVDGAVWFRFRDDIYEPWMRLGGNITGSPVVSSTGLLVARGVDNFVYRNEPAESGYAGWVSTGGQTTSAPTLSRSSTTYVIGLRGLDGAAWTRDLDVGTLTWTTGWTSLGGATAGPPVIFSADAVRGTDNIIYARAAQGWITTGGSASSDPSITKLGLVARGLDGAVWTYTPDTSTWSSLGGRTPNPPAATPPAEAIPSS